MIVYSYCCRQHASNIAEQYVRAVDVTPRILIFGLSKENKVGADTLALQVPLSVCHLFDLVITCLT